MQNLCRHCERSEAIPGDCFAPLAMTEEIFLFGGEVFRTCVYTVALKRGALIPVPPFLRGVRGYLKVFKVTVKYFSNNLLGKLYSLNKF
jgi:hypothetical protein